MVQKGVALETGKKGLKVWTDRDKLHTLRHAYIPTDQAKFTDMTDATNPTADQDYEEAATQVTYKDYMEFMNSSVLQASTNILHDHYCANGLKVTTVAGSELPFKIYGDNAMLQKDSDKGVRHSAITANMSRDSIYNIVKTGQPLHPLKSIFDRFPDRVELPNGSQVGLNTWHTGTLKAQCENGFNSIFREANRSIKTFGGGITGGNLSKKVSAEVHPGAAF